MEMLHLGPGLNPWWGPCRVLNWEPNMRIRRNITVLSAFQ
jgi:hypothetical protein